MRKRLLTILLLLISLSVQLHSQNIFVAVDGDDANPGTIDLPLKSIQSAISKIQIGDTIFVRGGVYKLSTTISVSSKNGNESSKYYLFAYPGERPVLDFSSMPTNSGNRGINFKTKYWHMKGFDIKGAGDNGMNLSGSNNIIEFCSFYENRDTGLQLGGGASNNQIINCDSYFNADPSNGNADGFAPKLDVGSGNYFYGCRAWQNSDDGWDGYMRSADDVSTTLENCWCFNNGYLKSGKASSGNGNGFKMGGSDTKTLMHNFTLKKCIAFDNRVKGFDQNNNKGSMILENCTAYRNGTNYGVNQALNQGKTLALTNCVALGSQGSIGTFAIQNTNSWMSQFVVDESDFVSIDTTGVRGPRKADGSLPDILFMHLAEGSDLIDAGTDIGLPFFGSAPDLGAFEYGIISSSKNIDSEIPETFVLFQNYPNPFNPETIIGYQLSSAGNVSLKVYDILGNEVVELVNEFQNPGTHFVKFNAQSTNYGKQLASGIYFYQLRSGAFTQTKKFILMK
jgi:hypothetical protein